jgi:hypothetical protein
MLLTTLYFKLPIKMNILITKEKMKRGLEITHAGETQKFYIYIKYKIYFNI